MAKTSHEIRIQAQRDRVFQALSTSEGLKGWYTPHLEGEVGTDREFVLRFTGREPFRWKVAELLPD